MKHGFDVDKALDMLNRLHPNLLRSGLVMDLYEALAAGRVDAPPAEEMSPRRGVGQKYRNYFGGTYIVATPQAQMAVLINIATGNNYLESVKVKCTGYITQEEWAEVTGGDTSHFTLCDCE